MTRVPLLFAALAAAVAISSVSPTAEAQTAEVLIEQGLDLRRQHRDEEALQRFQDAYQIGHSAQALAQIALAEQALGRFALAELHLQQALAIRADPWIASRQPQLQQALVSMGSLLGTVELQGGVAGAQVFVNGELRGTLPQAARIRARAGTAVIEIRAQGYLPIQRQVVVSVGGTTRETIQLIAAQGQVPQQPVQGQAYGVQAYPQPVYQPAPTRVSTRPIWGMFIAGIPIFVVPWILTGLIDLDFGSGIGFIPLAGPFILAAQTSDFDSMLQTLLIIDGVVQIAGVALIVLGLVIQREVVVRARLGDDPDSPAITLLPFASETSAGLSLALTHF